MIQRFLPYLVTAQDAQLLHQELQAIRQTQYVVSPDALEKALNEELRSDTAQILRKQLIEHKNTFYQNVDEVLAQLSRLPIVELSLAYQPTWKQLSELHQWFVQYLQKPVILKTRFLPTLIAGAEVAIDGLFFDLSIKKDLQNTVLSKWNIATK